MLKPLYHSTTGRCLRGALILILLTPIVAVHAASVSISDNIMVLSDQRRSGQIELLSMTPSTAEFTVIATELSGTILDGRDYVRWSPNRVSIPGNRSRPLRMVFRPPANLAPGEYVVRLQVQSKEVSYQSDSSVTGELSRDGDLGFNVTMQPALPVTVYLRHGVVSPELEITPFETSHTDPASHGHFMVRKAASAISFLGAASLVGEYSGSTISSGRLRMGQTVNELRIRVPRGKDEAPMEEPVCLHLWPQHPPERQPEQIICSD